MEKIGGLSKTEIWKISLKDLMYKEYPLEVIRELARKKYRKSEDFWYKISNFYNLDDDFLREFEDDLSDFTKGDLIMNQKLSERFLIRNFGFAPSLHEGHWIYTSKYQDLSEDFIKRYKEYVVWNNISMYQDLSEEFMIDFIELIVEGSFEPFLTRSGEEKIAKIPGLIHNTKISKNIKENIINLKKVIDQ